MQIVRRAAPRPHLLRQLVLRRIPYHWSKWHHLPRARDLVPSILATIPSEGSSSHPITWSIRSAVWTEVGVAVIIVGPVGGPPTAVLKLARTVDGVASVRRNRAVLATLHADPRLEGWSRLLPRLLAEGEVAGQFYVVEQALGGHDGLSLLSNPKAYMRLQRAAAKGICELHQRTGSSVVVDKQMLERWVDQPLLLLRRLVLTHSRAASYDAAIDRLSAELSGMLLGRVLTVSSSHGDFWLGNILIDHDGTTLTGIVDWDRAGVGELPILDLLHLVLYTRTLVQGCGFGDVVQALLTGSSWLPHERTVLEIGALDLQGEIVAERAAVLLCWLRHVAGNLAQSRHWTRDRLWVAETIEGVLDCL